MSLFEKAKILANSNSFKDDTKNFFENVISACAGDIAAMAKAISFITRSPMFIRECLFWEKFSMFLEGVFLSDEEVRKLNEIFLENEEKEEYCQRIISVIDAIDSGTKVKYIINLTNSLLYSFISKEDYYRLINIVKVSLFEDLIYLTKNIEKRDIKENINLIFLEQSGLVFKTAIGEYYGVEGVEEKHISEYEFTNIALMLDKFALNFGNSKYKYKNELKSLSSLTNRASKTSILLPIEIDGGKF